MTTSSTSPSPTTAAVMCPCCSGSAAAPSVSARGTQWAWASISMRSSSPTLIATAMSTSSCRSCSTPSCAEGSATVTFVKQQTVGPDLGFGVQGGAVADFDGDGWPDLAFSGTCDGPDCNCNVNWVHVYLNWTSGAQRPRVVPRPIGLRLKRARRNLRSGDCDLGQVKRRRSSSGRTGVVIRQSPSDGSVLPNGSDVNINVRRGR